MKEENRLKQIRLTNCLTQEKLAERSGISIRTIQRIEKGLALGSPHTIKALAKALDVEHKELLVLKENHEPPIESDLTKARIINCSILSILLIPFGNLILPTLLLFRYRSDKKANRIGRKIISFQIVATFILFFLCVIIFMSIGRGNGAIPLPGFICYVMIVVVNIIIVVRTSIEINRRKEVLKFFPNLL